MKVCITSTGEDKSSKFDTRFGRCAYFIIFDTEDQSFTKLSNEGVTSSQGAGIAASTQVVGEKVDIVISGAVGPNAMKVLQSANIMIYKGEGDTVESVLQNYQKGDLKKIEKAGTAHVGMKNQ